MKEAAFKTGDIILFHALDNINPIFIGSYFGHIGIVYVEDGIKYLFEAFSPTHTPFYPSCFKGGVSLSLLERRLTSYRGYCVYKELKKPIADAVCKDFKQFVTYAINNMYYDTRVLYKGLLKLLGNHPLDHGTNCGELVYLSLIKLGLLPMDVLNHNRKHHLRWLAQLTQLVGNTYKDPIYVLPTYYKTNGM